MSAKPNVPELVGRMPESDEPGRQSKLTGPDPEMAAKIFDEILSGGKEAVVELIGLIKFPADPSFESYKAEYVLHCLCVHAGAAEREAQRKMLSETLAAQLLEGHLDDWRRGVLCRDLLVVGGPESAPALGAQLVHPATSDDAARALLAIREGAGRELRAALPKAQGRCVLNIVQALAVLPDPEAAGALKEAAAHTDREVRVAAAFGLANLGDAGSTDVVLKAAEAADGWERIQGGKACLVLAEKLLAAGKKDAAVRVWKRLQETKKGEEAYLGEAAARGLATAG